jgi:predicted nucleic acid-binding protein
MEIKIVSNTTPIISLLGIGQLDLLKQIYGHCWIPETVYQEVEAGRNKAYYADLSKKDWISIESVKSIITNDIIHALDAGEAAAIMLALEQNADLLVIDERKGRGCARALNIPITGTLGVLLVAKERGLIDKIQPLVANLLTNSAWINPALVNNVLTLAGEIPQGLTPCLCG